MKKNTQDQRIKIGLTRQEKTRLQKAANQNGLTVSGFVRFTLKQAGAI